MSTIEEQIEAIRKAANPFSEGVIDGYHPHLKWEQGISAAGATLTKVPSLLAEVEALKAEVEELRRDDSLPMRTVIKERNDAKASERELYEALKEAMKELETDYDDSVQGEEENRDKKFEYFFESAHRSLSRYEEANKPEQV